MLNTNIKNNNRTKVNKAVMRRRRLIKAIVVEVISISVAVNSYFSFTNAEHEIPQGVSNVSTVKKESRVRITEIPFEELKDTQEWIRNKKVSYCDKTTNVKSDTECFGNLSLESHEHHTKKYDITEKEFELLCKVVYAEASPGRDNAKELNSIASTILNRTHEEETLFPNDITGVVFDDGEFSTTANGKVYWYREAGVKVELSFDEVNELTKECVREALDGIDTTRDEIEGGAIYFYGAKTISEAELEYRKNIGKAVQYGGTVFYREWK